MALDDRRERLEHRLQPLARRDQPERGEQEALAPAFVSSQHRGDVARCSAGGILVCAPRQHRGRAVRYDSDLVLGARATRDEQSPCRLGHHDHELRLMAERLEHRRLVCGRLRQHRVQRDDDGLRELVHQREDILAVASAEDPVLVLQEHDLDVEPAEDPGGANVVAAHPLSDRRHQSRPLRARGLVDHDDLLDPVDPVHAKQGRMQVGGKSADAAGARRIGRDDRGTRGFRAPFRQGSGTPARAAADPAGSGHPS